MGGQTASFVGIRFLIDNQLPAGGRHLPGAPLLAFEKWPAENRNRALRRQHRGPPFGYPPRLRSGLRQNWAGFLKKREKWRTPS
jgi:hypothetical protein